jgi:hypothetical protein
MGSSKLIYQVNSFDGVPTYFDSAINENAKEEAEVLLAKRREQVLIQEAVRFSICATFVDNSNTTWRNIKDEDPEDTVCQVFDHLLGEYEEAPNKTEAFALNEQRKQEFLTSIRLDKVYEHETMPSDQPVSAGLTTL